MKLNIKSANWPGVILTNKTTRDYLVYGLKTSQEEENYFYFGKYNLFRALRDK